MAPTLSVWKNGSSFLTPQLSYTVPLPSLREVLHSYENEIALYEHTIERQFDYGDMLGFSQPNASLSSVVLQYIKRIVPEVQVWRPEAGNTFSRVSSAFLSAV